MRHLLPFVLAAVLAAPLAAQRSPRQGFFLSIGAGSGSAGVACPDCGDLALGDRLSGVAGYLRFGGTVSPHPKLGLEGTGWIKNSDGLQRRIATAAVVLVVYPSRTAGFFVKGSAGGVRAVIESNFDSLVGEGLMWSAGAGYDIPLGAGAALTPYVSYFGSSNTGADLDGVSLGVNLNPNVLQFGIGFTIP